jgi:hypothetical protein
MRGDFSRIRFEPAKNYTAVLRQQGRVALDADANEQRAIDEHLRRTEIVDVVGEYAAPSGDAGFAISLHGSQVVIGAGRYYVEGILCENPTELRYDDQPFYLYPGVKSARLLEELAAKSGGATLRLFLEVWQRMVTALDDPCLQEPAIGPADTTARTQTVWRVVASLAGNADGNTEDGVTPCCHAMYSTLEPVHSGKLSATTGGASETCGCQPIATAGYRGLENQLYRVEIHQSGTETSATYKWSRENGSVVVAIESISAANIVVQSLGPDANLGFQVNDWVEISDDTALFGDRPNQPGALYQISSIDASTRTVMMGTTVLPIHLGLHPRMRRWDQRGTSATSTGVPVSTSSADLENGIQIEFEKGEYTTGDSWTIVARAATGSIDWPPCGSDGSSFQPAHYTKIYRAPLACIHATVRQKPRDEHIANPVVYRVDDCRRLFPPLTTVDTPPDAIHVAATNWTNDAIMAFDDLVEDGLTVTFDQAPTGPITSGNFIVVLELPIIVSRASDQSLQGTMPFQAALLPASGTTEVLATLAGGQATTVLRMEIVLDSLIQTRGTAVTWSLPFGTGQVMQSIEVLLLDTALANAMQIGQPCRVRVKLLGRTIYAGASTAPLYLDGQTFGLGGTSADGSTPRVDLQFPSGSGVKGSDFESWFYVYPMLTVVSAAIKYPALTVANVNGAIHFVSPAQGDGPPIQQQLAVTLNYPAVELTTINLSMTGDSTIVSVPATASVQAGGSSVVVNIDIIGVPAPPAGKNESAPSSFTVTASVRNAIGVNRSASQSFTVTGQTRPG